MRWVLRVTDEPTTKKTNMGKLLIFQSSQLSFKYLCNHNSSQASSSLSDAETLFSLCAWFLVISVYSHRERCRTPQWTCLCRAGLSVLSWGTWGPTWQQMLEGLYFVTSYEPTFFHTHLAGECIGELVRFFSLRMSCIFPPLLSHSTLMSSTFRFWWDEAESSLKLKAEMQSEADVWLTTETNRN